VETYIRNIQKEEIKKIIEINKKHEEEEREKDSIREEKKKKTAWHTTKIQ